MITHRVLVLLWLTHRAWPSYSHETISRVVVAAVANETIAVPAEFLIVIAQHESDFEPSAVSWRQHGRRVDLVWTPGHGRQPPNCRLTCGYEQAMASGRSDCAQIIAIDGGMERGMSELAEWARTCRGDLGCIARGHAGGSACAKSRARCSRVARRISDHFVRKTIELQGAS